jgi:hypothetical protein
MPPTSQPDAYVYRWHACIAGQLTWIDRSVGYGLASVHVREVHARMHARWPTRFRSDHACSMRVASASAARCTACGCTGRTQVCRREHAEHIGRCKHLPLPCARHLTRCYGLQPAALRTAGSMLMQCSRCCRLDCPPTFAAVQAHRSTVSQPVPIPSGVHGCGNRTDSRLGRGGAARRVVLRWTVDRRLLVGSVGAASPARQRRMRRDCAFSLAAVEQPDMADRPTKPPLMGRGVQ